MWLDWRLGGDEDLLFVLDIVGIMWVSIYLYVWEVDWMFVWEPKTEIERERKEQITKEMWLTKMYQENNILSSLDYGTINRQFYRNLIVQVEEKRNIWTKSVSICLTC